MQRFMQRDGDRRRHSIPGECSGPDKCRIAVLESEQQHDGLGAVPAPRRFGIRTVSHLLTRTPEADIAAVERRRNAPVARFKALVVSAPAPDRTLPPLLASAVVLEIAGQLPCRRLLRKLVSDAVERLFRKALFDQPARAAR
jgi:hypothetical protein